MPINNFGIINNCPTAKIGRCAQPDAVGCSDLKALGFDYIYKLNNEKEETNSLEQSVFKDGFIYDPYPPIYDIPPFDTIWKTVHKIRDLFINDKSVVVHCTHGRDRTGLIIGSYRILFDGWNFEQVQSERISFGATGLIDNIADSKIIEFLKNLK